MRFGVLTVRSCRPARCRIGATRAAKLPPASPVQRHHLARPSPHDANCTCEEALTRTDVWCAAAFGHTEAIKLLRAHGAPMQCNATEPAPILHQARPECDHRHGTALRGVLFGAHAMPSRGEIASCLRHSDVWNRLEQTGADWNGYTVPFVRQADKSGNLTAVKFLVGALLCHSH